MQFHHDQQLIQKNTNLLIYDIGLLRPADYANKCSDKIKCVFNYNELQKNDEYKFSFPVQKSQSVSWRPDGAVWIKYADTLLCAIPGFNNKNWVLTGYAPSVFGLNKEEFKYVSFDMSPAQCSDKIQKIKLTEKKKVLPY